MDLNNRHVIVTGGAGALGTALVARLIEAGAVCHVPCLNEAEAARFRLRDHKQVTVTITGSLAEEAAIEKLYRGMPSPWASIHTVGGYAASKAGVAALTAALAEEVAKDGILVNAVAPSIMDTPANRQAMPKADYALWPKVDEVAATIAFLASPENRVTRGAIVPVYGK